MQKTNTLTIFALILLTGLAGCAASPPIQEMSDARQAIMAAEVAGADEYAGETLAAAHSLMERAEAKLDEHDYKGARSDAVSAHSHALEARVLARSQMPRMD
jgi:outer membrane murein-binding lipoprotein Lpp